MTSLTANYDESWKEALTEYFDSFLAFFFAEIYQQIDWTKTPQSLDKELQQITASSDSEKCIADIAVFRVARTPKFLLGKGFSHFVCPSPAQIPL